MLLHARMRSLALLLALLFTSGTVYAESAAWLEDYIEKNPSRQLTKTSPEPKASTPKASKVTKAKAKKAAAKKAKAKRSKSKRGRRR